MIKEFDKEIDFLLRRTARGETAFAAARPNSNHLDADEISAFSENALPEKIRQNYVVHLADCEHCRKNLANLIALNNDAAESEIIHHIEPSTETAIAAAVPWYRKFFAAPGLVYAMGALIVMFAGIGVFTVLQTGDAPSSQISQVSEKQTGGKGMSADGDQATQEIYNNPAASNMAATSNTAATNTMANASNTALAAAPVSAANSNSALMRLEPEANADDARKDEKSLIERDRSVETADSAVTAAAPPPAKPGENNFELDGQEKPSPNASPIVGGTQNQQTQNQTQITPDTRNAPRAQMPVIRQESREDKEDDDKKLVAKRKSAETTSVGGKTFSRAGSVWTDQAYRGQTTTNVSRGTNEYKKLDSGLRGIVENLGGTVIVVWKEKAYRIQ